MIWVALVDDAGLLTRPIAWEGPITAPLHEELYLVRRSEGEVHAIMWRSDSPDPSKAKPKELGRRPFPMSFRDGDRLTLNWNVRADFQYGPTLPVSLHHAIDDAIRQWAES